MRIGDFARLLRENNFSIHPARYPMTVLVGGCAVVNSSLAAIQQLTHGKKIRETELLGPPIFVIGHWRSGTTLMHELLALDSRFAFPSNFDAFIPHHFLVSRFFFYPLVKLLMPPKRPMDNMSMGVASPQEDDFALCAYGAPTPYRRIAFPNRISTHHQLLNLANASEAELSELRTAMEQFLKTLTVRYQKQLVLKSPPHTGRIEKLAQWFPGAKFIHIARHPYQLVPSTMRLWQTLDQLQGFQLPKYDDATLQKYIFDCQQLMYTGYQQQRASLPTNQLIEIRFEDLVAAPLEAMSRVYSQLELASFANVQPAIENYFVSKQNHQKNSLSLEPGLQTEIDARWSGYKEMFGY